MRQTKMYEFMVFSHELLEDELKGNGDLHGLGENQAYEEYYIVTAKDKTEAYRSFLDKIYESERKDIYFFKNLLCDFIRDSVYEPYEEAQTIDKESNEYLQKISLYFNKKFEEKGDRVKDFIDEQSSIIENEEFGSNLSEAAIRYVWEVYSAKGRFGILQLKQI